jgi:multidrug resistance protein, MATE family
LTDVIAAPESQKTLDASENLGHREILAIALPIIFSNATTPLIGVVDTAVVGRLGPPELIGGVALGSIIFGVLFWAFGFLRMGATGLTAQARGAGKRGEAAAVLVRAAAVAVTAGAALILLRTPIRWFCLWLLDASPEAQAGAAIYFDMRIWSAPAAFVNYALLGWFIGMRRVRTAFALQMLLNLLNMALSIAFVAGLGMTVAGVALAAVLAEMSAAAVGLILAWGEVRGMRHKLSWARIFHGAALSRMFTVNSDIMIRSLCLMSAFLFFTAQGARAGDILLAANAVLFEFVTVFAYFLDGFATSAEVLTGGAVGGRRLNAFRQAFWLSSLWAGTLSFALSAFCWLTGGVLIDAMAVNPEVRAAARVYLGWAALAPIMGVTCFQLDGVFVGATRTADMRNMMAVSLAAYLVAWAALSPVYGNHGLWASLMVFYAVRGMTLAARYPALVRATFAGAG